MRKNTTRKEKRRETNLSNSSIEMRVRQRTREQHNKLTEEYEASEKRLLLYFAFLLSNSIIFGTYEY
jgi:hypothetical protein